MPKRFSSWAARQREYARVECERRFLGVNGRRRAISIAASAPILAPFVENRRNSMANRTMFRKTESSVSHRSRRRNARFGLFAESFRGSRRAVKSGPKPLENSRLRERRLWVDGGDPGVDMFGRDRAADRQSVVAGIVEVAAGQFAVPGWVHFVTQSLGIGVTENP